VRQTGAHGILELNRKKLGVKLKQTPTEDGAAVESSTPLGLPHRNPRLARPSYLSAGRISKGNQARRRGRAVGGSLHPEFSQRLWDPGRGGDGRGPRRGGGGPPRRREGRGALRRRGDEGRVGRLAARRRRRRPHGAARRVRPGKRLLPSIPSFFFPDPQSRLLPHRSEFYESPLRFVLLVCGVLHLASSALAPTEIPPPTFQLRLVDFIESMLCLFRSRQLITTFTFFVK